MDKMLFIINYNLQLTTLTSLLYNESDLRDEKLYRGAFHWYSIDENDVDVKCYRRRNEIAEKII